MGLNMDQYVKTLSNDSEDKIKVPFSASHFESALNSANDQLMQRYIATEDCFFCKFIGRLTPRTEQFWSVNPGRRDFMKNWTRIQNWVWKRGSVKLFNKMRCSVK